MWKPAAALIAVLLAGDALAQGDPGLTYGQIPSAAQWNSYFAAKVDTVAGAFGGAVVLKVYTVSTLPTCGSTLANAMAAVSDATAPTYRAALTGGGSVHVPVFCDGSSWTSH